MFFFKKFAAHIIDYSIYLASKFDMPVLDLNFKHKKKIRKIVFTKY